MAEPVKLVMALVLLTAKVAVMVVAVLLLYIRYISVRSALYLPNRME